MFDKFFGKQKAYLAAIDLTQGSSTDSDENISDPPAKRVRLTTEQKLTKKIDDMHETLQEIKRSAKTIPEMVKSAMECIICRNVVTKPQFMVCCQRIVGCEGCLNNWFADHNTCPHCAQPVSDETCIEVKGLDDILKEFGDK